MDNSNNVVLKSRAQLGQEVKIRQFFSLAFGAIIGIGWIIILGEWLNSGGPLGSIIAYAVGAFFILVVGLCYAEMATLLPVSGGEVAYTYEIFGIKVSFALGWFLCLAYIASISFEAISAGWIISTIFPSTGGSVLYSIRGYSLQAGILVIALGGNILLTYFNYRGVKSALLFQEILTYGILILSLVFILAGIIWGNPGNLMPLFPKKGTGPVLKGIMTVFIMTPFMFGGFNVIPQTMEEKSERTSVKLVGKVMLLAILSAALFYILVILSASMAVPWKRLIPMELPAAGAFEAAFNSSLMAKIVLFAGLFGIITTWNTLFILSSRIIFALGRGKIIPEIFGVVHSSFKSPLIAILFVGVLGSVGIFLGKSAILPVVNIAGACFSFAYLCTCFGVLRLRYTKPDTPRPYRVPGGKFTAMIAVMGSILMLFLALYQPATNVKGELPLEWGIIIFWGFLGIVFWKAAGRIRAKISQDERRLLIFGESVKQFLPGDTNAKNQGKTE